MKGDREVNNKKSMVYDRESQEFKVTSWGKLRLGDIVKVQKDTEFPADILFLSAKSDIIFVDTMNLDGETNLKPKVVVNEKVHEALVPSISGVLECDAANASLEMWDGIIKLDNPSEPKKNVKINNLLLRGCFLRNIREVYGMVVYVGPKTKIMMNSKQSKRKVSNLMKMMNYMLYTVFCFQLGIILLFATMSTIWIKDKGEKYDYLNIESGRHVVVIWVI